jgi:DNA ligase (NAD+)
MKEYFEVPKNCPECGGPAVVQGKFLVCTNLNCSGLATGNLERWITVLDIEGLGPKIIQMLFENNLVKEPADFYKLTVDKISVLDRMGVRSATKIVNNLKAKMQLTLPELMAGLNMPNFSTRTTECLVESGFDTVEKIYLATESDLVQVKGIESKTAQQIMSGIRSKREIIEHLSQVGISIKKQEVVEIESNKFAGMSFCFTGAIQAIKEDGKRYTREDMHSIVLSNGGKVEDSVKRGLSYLVMADPNSASGKSKKARELGVSVLGEKEFFTMVA